MAMDRGLHLVGDQVAGGWEVAGRPPAVPLRRLVHVYCGYDERTPGAVHRVEAAQPWVTLLIDLCATHHLSRPAAGASVSHKAFVVGLRDGPLQARHAGRSRGVEVMLSPLGAHRLLRVPLGALDGGVVALDAVLGPAGASLARRIGETASWGAAFDELDGFFLRLLDRGRRWSPEIALAWHRLETTSGRAAIGQLVQETGWSRRRLALRFREQVGLTPKTTAQLLRFRAAAALLARPGHRSLASIALASGYYDQAHLNRDFARFAGCTPAAFRRARSCDAIATEIESLLPETIVQDATASPL
jgi:AraC-like DNA-binding protein